MSRARPLMQHGVAVLEALFEKSRSDNKALKQLENELKFRDVPRARALLVKVQQLLQEPQCGEARQAPMFPAEGAITPSSLVATSATANERAPESQSTRANKKYDLESACLLLKVSANAPWEEVERARRHAIKKLGSVGFVLAETSAKMRLLSEAANLNQAYRVIFANRLPYGAQCALPGLGDAETATD